MGLGATGMLGAIATRKSRNRLSHYLQAFQAQASDDPARSFAVDREMALGDRAAAKGLLYGAATQLHLLEENPEFADRFVQECKVLVTENDLNWREIRPAPSQFDFAVLDQLFDFTQAHNLLFRGHSLIWHLREILPPWLRDSLGPANAEWLLIDHVRTVVHRYAGQTHSWDVVNEAIDPSDGRADGLRDSLWLQALGPDYIDLAFRVAAETDPTAMLVYNDHGLVYDIPRHEARRTATLKLLERLQAQGTPVHALGIQSHLSAQGREFNPQKMRAFLRNVADLDLKILITELDVSDYELPTDLEVRDRLVAAAYEDYLSVVLDEPAVIAVINWGLSDPHSWLSWARPRSDEESSRPLPFDENLQPKLAWNAIARAFDNAPPR